MLLYNEGNNNPYHNIYHITTMVKNLYFIANDEGIDDKIIRLIIIAGLFHDFNHSGGKFKDDSDNVKIAIEAFKKYSKENDKDNQFIINLITITKYPYEKTDNLTLYEKIMRDAVLLQFTDDNFIQEILFGLNKEMNKSDILTVDLLNNQIKFINGSKFYTEYANLKAMRKINYRVEDCEYLIKILS